MKRNRVQLHEGMGTAVLRKLQSVADLGPVYRQAGDDRVAEVFVAGQAVASAVSELFWDGAAVAYNDVDAFVMQKYEESSFPWVEQARASRKALARVWQLCPQVATDYGQLTRHSTSVYQLEATRRIGELNEIACSSSFTSWGRMESRLFLRSFDLNCVQVGVRLSDRKLIWTDAFDAFMHSRQLAVVSAGTPVHTAVRWFRKRRELAGVYGNDALAMEMLAAVMARFRAALHAYEHYDSYARDLMARLSMGGMYTEKAQSVMGDLGKWMRLENRPGWLGWIKTLVPLGTPGEDLMNADVLWSELPLYAAARRGVYPRRLCRAIETITDRPVDDLGRINLAREGVSIVTSMARPDETAWLHREAERHIGLTPALRALAQRQQLWLFESLRHVARKRGQWVYGAIEYRYAERTHQDVRRIEGAGSAEEMLMAIDEAATGAIAEIESLASRLSGAEITRLGRVAVGNYVVRELDTFRGLWDEAEEMHHCAGGYWPKVARGEQRIFSLNPGSREKRLTLRVARTGSHPAWRLVECKGRFNRMPGDDEMRVAFEVVDMINGDQAADVGGERDLGESKTEGWCEDCPF